MRAAAAVLVPLVIASGASAQGFDTQVRTQHLEQQIENVRQRDVALSNEMMALEARAQTERSIGALQAQRSSPGGRAPVDYPALDRARVGGGYTSIPDDRLAASNARVRAAAQNQRR